MLRLSAPVHVSTFTRSLPLWLMPLLLALIESASAYATGPSPPSTDDLFNGPVTRTVGPAVVPKITTPSGQGLSHAFGDQSGSAPDATIGRNDPCPCGSGK